MIMIMILSIYADLPYIVTYLLMIFFFLIEELIFKK